MVTPALPDCIAERLCPTAASAVSLPSSVVVCAVLLPLSVPDELVFCAQPVQVIIAATAMLIAQANIFFCMIRTLLFDSGTPWCEFVMCKTPRYVIPNSPSVVLISVSILYYRIRLWKLRENPA